MTSFKYKLVDIDSTGLNSIQKYSKTVIVLTRFNLRTPSSLPKR